MPNANRSLVRAGFVLFCLALITGFGIPSFVNPRMALAAHLTGVMNALVLIALGLIWPLLTVSRVQEKVIRTLFLFAAFTNWGTSCLAAAWGTGRLTPLSSPGMATHAWKETLVQTLQISVALSVLTGAVLVVYGLRVGAGQRQGAASR